MEYTLQHLITQVRGAGILRLCPSLAAGAKPVIVLHGLGSNKEQTLPLLYYLAEAGFDVVGIDLFMHGERPEAAMLGPMLDRSLAETVFRIIYESAADVGAICDELGVDLSSAGLVGVSCGGFVAHALAVQRPQFNAMVALISSPDWLSIDPAAAPPAGSDAEARYAASSPINHADKYPPIAVCQLNGLADQTVSPVGAPRLHERLQPIYTQAGMADRLEIALYDDVGHQVTSEMIGRTIGFLSRWL